MTKTQELKIFDYKGLTHVGNVRNENEDTYEYFESVNGSVFLVCDGMGGVKGGKQAAEAAAIEIKRFISEEWFDNPKDLLTETLARANAVVYDLFPDALIKPGTTVVLVIIRQNKIWYAHAGDSRLYYFTGKKLFQLTRDHSYVEELVQKKVISEEDALTHPRRNEITKALGTHEFIDPTVCKSPIEPSDEDYLLLCTDGLINEIGNKGISEILTGQGSVAEKSSSLVERALESGGTDNITVQLLKFYNTGKNHNLNFSPEKSENPKTRKYKIITGFFGLIILISLAYLINEFVVSDEKINDVSVYSSYLNIKINDNKDTLAQVFMLSQYSPEEVSEKFHADMSEIGYVSAKTGSHFSKYYIPVKNICIFGTGNCLIMYPEVTEKRMIDLMIVNKKNRLYFLPGEIFLIPKD